MVVLHLVKKIYIDDVLLVPDCNGFSLDGVVGSIEECLQISGGVCMGFLFQGVGTGCGVGLVCGFGMGHGISLEHGDVVGCGTDWWFVGLP